MYEKKVAPVALDHIRIGDPFWKPYMELVRNHVIPYQWEALNDRIENAEPSHCIRNFRIAAGLEEGDFQGYCFQDSDVYKWLEAVAYSLMWHADPELEKTADETIELIASAQQPDGYLDTYYIIRGLDKRFTNLMDCHELYCLGHMIEAAVAYYKATGKDRFLKVATRFVDCVYENLGTEPGKIPGYPGHEVAEMALVLLYGVTGEEKHLKLAKYFIDQRGQSPLFFDEEEKKNNNNCYWNDSYMKKQYYQAGKPVRMQKKAEGHAVRAVYLYSGMAEVAAATEDATLFEACETLWNNIVQRQMYVTGAIGSTQYGESFTFDYDLPNDTIYAETCAAIGLIFFARRMFEITGESRYIDVMENTLFNAVISGMSLDGKSFFYVNPLEANPESSLKDYYKRHVKIERQKWFGCACCPPNIARLLSSIGGYAYEQNADEIYMNLFIGGEIEAELGGKPQKLSVETGYPWNGDVALTVHNDSESEFTLAVRIPGWCDTFEVIMNGEKIAGKDASSVQAEGKDSKGYVKIKRTWRDGDTVILKMDMPIRLLEANPRVRADAYKVAITRGPLVYCLEEADNGQLLQNLSLADTPDFNCHFEKDMANGVVVIDANGHRISENTWASDQLYRVYAGGKCEDVKMTFIPYYSWANRSPGEMLVWVKR